MPRRPRTAAVPRSASVLDVATGCVPTPSAAARIAGANARASGRAFEHALGAVHRLYDVRGEALIEKVNAPTEGWGGSLRVAESTVDYTGTWFRPEYIGHDGLRRDARRVGIAFDAKCIHGAGFGAPMLPRDDTGKHLTRFYNQVGYLRNVRDRHGYVAGFLLYAHELETAWWLGGTQLDALAAGQLVPVRTIERATKARARTVVHHLPHVVAPLAHAAISQVNTRRPLLDYLTMILNAKRYA